MWKDAERAPFWSLFLVQPMAQLRWSFASIGQSTMLLTTSFVLICIEPSTPGVNHSEMWLLLSGMRSKCVPVLVFWGGMSSLAEVGHDPALLCAQISHQTVTFEVLISADFQPHRGVRFSCHRLQAGRLYQIIFLIQFKSGRTKTW